MNCTAIETHAIDYLHGKLSRQESAAVELHVAECASCAERLRGFSEVIRLLDSWEAIQPSASFNGRLEQRILAHPELVSGWWERFWFRFRLFPLAKPALAGVVLGIVIFAVIVARYSPASFDAPTGGPATTPIVANVSNGSDELVLYQDLPVLENLDLLSNFEVLQELKTTTP